MVGAAEAEAFNIDLSFQVLFMIIIGGLGSIVVFSGAAIIYLMPIGLRALPAMFDLAISLKTIDQLTTMITGVLIIVFLIAPTDWPGSGKTWKHKLRVWPFPY